MPTLTNPNNMSIVTGVAPSGHGIPGNHCLLEGRSEPVQLVEPELLRATTIHAQLQRAGRPVLAITAKDKLRRLLGAGGVPAVSAEKARELSVWDERVADFVERPAPSIYDWDLSHYALELGLALSRRWDGEAGLLYVSLTDFVQHKEPPGGALADRFYARFDELLGSYLDEGFLVGITADHGMHAKQEPDGSPRVRYLEDILYDGRCTDFQVVLPITDPYVVHHGALGSFAWVYLRDAAQIERARAVLSTVDGVEEVLTREEATVTYDHPPDRIGDLSVSSDACTALGQARAKHDLSYVATGLRSHGGRHEQAVPIIVSRPLREEYAARHQQGVRNSDIHDLLLNGTR